MKKLILITLIVLLAAPTASEGAIQEIEAHGRRLISDRVKRPESARKSAAASHKPGELLVRFAPRANGKQRTGAEKKAFLASIGAGNVKRSYHIVPGLTHIKLPQGQSVENALKRLKGKGEILYAEPNYEVRALVEPNDTWFIALWGMHNEGQSGGTVDADIDAPEAWDLETDANEIIVAVIDSGVDYNHVDLSANMWTDANGCYGYDFVNDDNDPMDDAGHGTHCAGTIGTVGNNGEGVVGVCWDVQIMAVKFLNSSGTGYTHDAIAAIQYAVNNGADVLSNSWGGGGYSEGLKDAIEAADANGVLFVAAAGNDSANNDTYPHYPSSYDCNNIIAVLSTDKYDEMSDFSNYGPTSVDLGAPGSSIKSCQLGGGYTYGSGTSMATPHVAGACALVWAEHPSKSCLEVKETVVWTADELDDLDANCVTSGRLNLYRALADKKVKNVTQGKWYDAIQDALDDANDLDIIRARPGAYYENVDFNGVSCTLTSIDPNDPCVVAATIIDANGSGTVVTFDSNEDANAVLTGFTITGGYNSSVNGGGIYCYSTSPTINNCVVEDNYAYFGGGMGSVGGNPTITGCTFLGNEASWGAGMWSQQGNPTVTSCTFSDNSASFRGGGIFVFEGGATTTNCTFIRNSSTLEGGGMHQLESTSTVKDCLFHHNTANGGGGLYNDSSDLTVANCVFSSNSALRRGGGIHNYSNNATGDTTLTNCTFVNNSATNDDPTRGAYGGGMSNYNFGSLTVTNCIFWDNCADDGWDEIYNQYRDPNLSYCDVEGCGGSGRGWDPNIGNDDGNNIDADPCLVDANDPNGPDDIWATIDDGLQLGSGSPCIDAADNDAITLSTDIAGSVRKRDDPCTTDTGNGTPPIVDMGAYEHLANATIYVDVSATGGVYNGLSWGTAFKDLQAAIDYCISGDQILVAEGTYLLTSTLELAKELDIYGGYDADTGLRDTKNNLTIVDGDDTVRCFYVTADCTVDGFTITDGNAWNPDTEAWTDDVGGGMFNYLCDPNINDCNFYQNYAYEYGGAIENYQANPTITDCNFTGNVSDNSGGGVDNWLSSPTLTNCTFSGNTADSSGGGLYNASSSPTVTSCTFSGNSAETGRGGGMRNLASDPSVSNCTFVQNEADDDGGGMANRYSDPNVIECSFSNNTAYRDGGGMDNDYSDPNVVDCTFTDNTAYSDGAGMDNYFSDPNVIDCNFINNDASDDGGGMFNEESFLTLDDCVFSQNTAGNDGGGMYNDDSLGTVTSCVFWDNNSADDGGGMYNDDSCPNLINCTFVLNETLGDDGGGIYNHDVSDVILVNCILYYNDADSSGNQIYNDDSEPILSYCNVDGCDGSGEDWDPDYGIDGGNNIEEYPDFEDRYDGDGPDDVWGTCDDGLNLESYSDCKNAGNNEAAQEDYDGKDVKGSDRIINNIVDMGAYEYDSGC